LAFERDLRESNDRRYAEVNAAKAEALKIKEAGDAKALDLAREIQDYKDKKANELREQISRERGAYVSQDQFKPIADYVASQQGGSKVWMYVAGAAWAVALVVFTWLLRGGVS
jgi:vacuolar-type H+-ATPase subunit H